jgi:hypothetical protein
MLLKESGGTGRDRKYKFELVLTGPACQNAGNL